MADWLRLVELAPKHTVFLNNPTTSPNAAVKAAHEIGVQLDRRVTKTKVFNIVGSRDHLEMIGNRWRSKADSLTTLQAGADILAHGKSLHGLGLTVGTVFAGAAAVTGIGLTAPAALTAFLTAIAGAVAVGKIAGGTVSLGNTLVENALPKHHDKLKGKF